MGTILHVEDVDAIRKMVAYVLAKAGYSVLEAATIAEAEKLWTENIGNIELVISDNALPDGSGLALVKRLESEKPGLGVIITSGLPHKGLPANYYQLAKPFNTQFLLEYVRKALKEP